MVLKQILPKVIYLFFILLILVTCNTLSNANDDTSVYALKNTKNFKDVKGYMVYSYTESPSSNMMELRLRNLDTGKEETLLSSSTTNYSSIITAGIGSDGELIFVKAHKNNDKKTYMVLYNLKLRSYQEVNVGHVAVAGDVSSDKSKLVFYSDFTENHNYSIYISDLKGEQLEKIECPGMNLCAQPSWSEDGSRIVYISDRRKIYEYNIKTKKNVLRYTLTNKRKFEIDYPRFFNKDIYFSKVRKSNSKTEIVKISNRKLIKYYFGKDKSRSISKINNDIFLMNAIRSGKYSKIKIINSKTKNEFSLTKSDIRESYTLAPFYISAQ